MMNPQPIDRSILIAEYQAYREQFNRTPNMWDTPNAREYAGYCLQYPAPIHAFENLAPISEGKGDTGYWCHVRSNIQTALNREQAQSAKTVTV